MTSDLHCTAVGGRMPTMHGRPVLGLRLVVAVVTLAVLALGLVLAPGALAAAGDATYTFSARYALIDAPDYGLKIVADGSSNLVFAGDCSLDATTTGVSTYSVDSTGVPRWSSIYVASSPGSSCAGMAVDGAGNSCSVGAQATPDGGTDYVAVMLQSDGSLIGVPTYDGPKKNDEALAVAAGAGGSFYVTGMSQGADGDMDIVTIKYDASGTRRWVRRFNGAWDRHDRGLAVSVRGSSVFVAGISSHPKHGWDTVLLRYTTAGTRRWARYYDDTARGYEWVTGIAVTGRSVYVCGSGKGNASLSSSDALLLKYGYSGRRVWAKWVAGARGGRDGWLDIGIAPGGYVNATGYVDRSGTGLDAATASYLSAGRRRWLRYCASAGAQSDVGWGVAVASDGRTYVGGTGYGAAGNDDVLCLCYSTDGTAEWTTFWDSGPGNDEGRDIALTNGRAWVVGSQATFGLGTDLVVVGFER